MTNEIYSLRNSPHVVILGAGASIAAIPNGDKYGMKTSVMKGFIDKLGMRDILNDLELKIISDNLEDIYSEISSMKECKVIKEKLEESIYNYFNSFEIPDELTVYDYLILSLTSKDLIATFNWDPLLVQAYQRMHQLTSNLPELAFLHGNVAYGYCKGNHKKYVRGFKGLSCEICSNRFFASNLLYPINNKDYNNDRDIKFNWDLTQKYLKQAFMVTIFGYSAPKTDKEAIDLLQIAWGNKEVRKLEEISIIDITDEDTLINTWDDFVYSHHYNITNNYFDSYLGKFPRRSTEATFDMLFGSLWQNGDIGFKDNWSFDKLYNYVKPLLDDELGKSVNNLTNPYNDKFEGWENK